MSLSTSDYAGDGFRLRNFRHGEAPWQERELRTLVPLTLEVERNRDASTPLLKFLGHQYLLLHSEFECSPEFRRLVARRRYEKPDSSVPGMD